MWASLHCHWQGYRLSGARTILSDDATISKVTPSYQEYQRPAPWYLGTRNNLHELLVYSRHIICSTLSSINIVPMVIVAIAIVPSDIV